MTASKNSIVRDEVETFMHGLEKRNPGEHEFHQAVREVIESLMPYVLERPEYRQAQILERLTEPDRIIIFRVTWEDDEGTFRESRLASSIQQFNRSLQRRDAFSSERDPKRAEVFRFRANL